MMFRTMGHLVCLAIAILHVLPFCVPAEEELKWTRQVQLDPNGMMHLRWLVTGDTITMEVTGRSKGYVGLGFSPNGAMTGADIVFGWVKDGRAYIQDRYALKNGRPLIDPKQDYQLISGIENNTHTTIRFKRKLDTCDTHDYKITDDTIRVIWAMNDNDPIDMSADAPEYHGPSRGVESLFFLDDPPKQPDLNQPSISSAQFKMENAQIPDGLDTLYWCKIFKLPARQLVTKHQLIGSKPVIQTGHETLVHHMLLYECHAGEDEERDLESRSQDPKEGSICYTSETPKSFIKCRTVIIGWGKGSEGEFSPPEAGYPLGKQYGGATYFMLEVHYDNPQKKIGLYDSSGLEMYFTSEPRQNDAGILSIGHSVQYTLLVPPVQSSILVRSHCISNCTAMTFPGEGVKAFQVFLHSHLLGRKIRLRHYRNNQELPPIAIDDHYDFNYQQSRALSKHLTILPNDLLTVECLYDSSKRNFTTKGGESTHEEMCLAFMAYYPRVDISWCLSEIPVSTINDLLGVKEMWPMSGSTWDDFRIREPVGLSLKNQSFGEYLRDYTWKPEQVSRLQQLYLKGEKYAICTSQNVTSLLSNTTTTPEEDIPDYIPHDSHTCQDDNNNNGSASSVSTLNLLACLLVIFLKL